MGESMTTTKLITFVLIVMVIISVFFVIFRADIAEWFRGLPSYNDTDRVYDPGDDDEVITPGNGGTPQISRGRCPVKVAEIDRTGVLVDWAKSRWIGDAIKLCKGKECNQFLESFIRWNNDGKSSRIMVFSKRGMYYYDIGKIGDNGLIEVLVKAVQGAGDLSGVMDRIPPKEYLLSLHNSWRVEDSLCRSTDIFLRNRLDKQFITRIEDNEGNVLVKLDENIEKPTGCHELDPKSYPIKIRFASGSRSLQADSYVEFMWDASRGSNGAALVKKVYGATLYSYEDLRYEKKKRAYYFGEMSEEEFDDVLSILNQKNYNDFYAMAISRVGGKKGNEITSSLKDSRPNYDKDWIIPKTCKDLELKYTCNFYGKQGECTKESGFMFCFGSGKECGEDCLCVENYNEDYKIFLNFGDLNINSAKEYKIVGGEIIR